MARRSLENCTALKILQSPDQKNNSEKRAGVAKALSSRRAREAQTISSFVQSTRYRIRGGKDDKNDLPDLQVADFFATEPARSTVVLAAATHAIARKAAS